MRKQYSLRKRGYLTEKECLLIDAVVEYFKKERMAPTQTELAAILHTSLSAVQNRLFNLRREGFVQYEDNSRRQLKILKLNHWENVRRKAWAPRTSTED